MRFLLICISVLFFAFGCGKPDEDETQSDAKDQESPPNLVFIKTEPPKNDLDLEDQLRGEEPAERPTASEEEEQTISAVENSPLEDARTPTSAIENPPPSAVEEQTITAAAKEEQIDISIESEPPDLLAEQTKAETETAEQSTEEEGAVEEDGLNDGQIETAAVVGETELNQAGSVKPPAVQIETKSFFPLEPAVCRGNLEWLKNSCEFMPEWLKNVQAKGEDITIKRSRHGITVIWNSGIFEGGSFRGLWKNGACRGGVMESVVWDQGIFDTGCRWKNGLWKDGICQAEDCSHTAN